MTSYYRHWRAELMKRAIDAQFKLQEPQANQPAAAEWVRHIPKRELTTIHHALRLAAKYPGMSTAEADEITKLADVCWNEHVRRVEERHAA